VCFFFSFFYIRYIFSETNTRTQQIDSFMHVNKFLFFAFSFFNLLSLRYLVDFPRFCQSLFTNWQAYVPTLDSSLTYLQKITLFRDNAFEPLMKQPARESIFKSQKAIKTYVDGRGNI
jgi:hypothetical protein